MAANPDDCSWDLAPTEQRFHRWYEYQGIENMSYSAGAGSNGCASLGSYPMGELRSFPQLPLAMIMKSALHFWF